MQVTHVRVRLSSEEGKLRAYCSVEFDECMVIHDIKVIEHEGSLFLSMPCRKLKGQCPHCGATNFLTYHTCHHCQKPTDFERTHPDKLYADTVHPLTPRFRAYLQGQVLRAYNDALNKAKVLEIPVNPEPEALVEERHG